MASRTAVIAQRILAAVSANGPQSLARGVTTLAVEGTGGLSSRLFSSVPILQEAACSLLTSCHHHATASATAPWWCHSTSCHYSSSAAAAAAGGGGEQGGKSEGRLPDDIQQQLKQAGDNGDMSAVFNLVESHGESFDEGAVASALTALRSSAGRLDEQQLQEQVHKAPTFQLLVDMAMQSAGRFSNETLSRVVHALGDLKYHDEMVLDALTRNLIDSMDNMNDTQLHDLVQGLAQVDHSPSVLLLDAVCDRVLELGDNVGRDRRDEIMNGLERLGHSCKTHQPNPPKPRNDRSGRGEAEM
eukprot:jgi/Chrzof1/3410/Cz12g24090.t1